MRIVLVDGCDERRDALAALLKSHSFVVEPFISWSEAVRRIYWQRPVAVVAEVGEGQRLVQELRCHPEYANVPVLGLVGEGSEQPASGFCAVLAADCQPKDLIMSLLTVLDCHAANAPRHSHLVSWICSRDPGAFGQ